MKRKVIAISMLVVGAALIGIIVYVYLLGDHTPPVVEFTAEVPTYTEGDDPDVLLSNLRAYDYEDGDVSSLALIDSISPQSNMKSAKVVYVVRDSSNNMTVASQVVPYIPLDKDNIETTSGNSEDSAKMSN